MPPKAECAIVERQKRTEYLLCRTHREAGSKAAFFRQSGFKREPSEMLAGAWLRLAALNSIVSKVPTAHGVK